MSCVLAVVSASLLSGEPIGSSRVIPPWQDFIFTVRPSARAFCQNAIVVVAAAFDQAFEADVAGDFESERLEQERRQKSGNSSVAIAEGMNAEEIEDESGEIQEWRNCRNSGGLIIVSAKQIDGSGSFGGRGWGEPYSAITGWEDLNDLVIALFPFASVGACASLGE